MLSYLTALPSRDLIRAARQQITVEWWAGREAFELFVSEAVLAEVRRGDADAATRRIAAAGGIPVLSTSPAAEQLAVALLSAAALPPKAAIDALHVASAAVHGMHFLLTWNCAHNSRPRGSRDYRHHRRRGESDPRCHCARARLRSRIDLSCASRGSPRRRNSLGEPAVASGVARHQRDFCPTDGCT